MITGLVPMNRVSGFAGRGVTLVELVVTLAVLALLISLGMPSFADWIQNMRLRSTGESLSGILQLARSEAIRKNDTVILQVTTSVENDCTVSPNGTSWVVSLCPAEEACGAEPDRNQMRPVTGCVAGEPMILAKGSFQSGGVAEIDMDNGMICYSGLGRINPVAGNCPAGSLDPAVTGGTAIINVRSTEGACVDDGGDMRCLRITIGPGGESRLCDPAVTKATDPRIC